MDIYILYICINIFDNNKCLYRCKYLMCRLYFYIIINDKLNKFGIVCFDSFVNNCICFVNIF